MTRPAYVSMILAVALLATFAAPSAQAQKRKPTPIDTRPPAPDIRGFTETYQRANEPEMIVLVGIVAGGQEAGERDVAKFDPEADSDALRRRIEENLLEARVELIEQSSLNAARRRELNLLAQQDEGQIIEAVKERFNADVAIKIAMQKRGGDAKYRVTVDTLSVSRGRKIGTFSFDWILNDDAVSVKEYGDAVTRKVFDQFIKFYGPGDANAAEMRYTVLMVGVEDNRAIRDATTEFEKIRGVNRVRVRGNVAAADGRKATSLEIRYKGDMFNLATDMEEVASRVLGMRIDGTDANAGTITLIAKDAPKIAVVSRSPCEELFDSKSDRHELFKERYKSDGRPRVTILINREVFKGERQNQDVAKNFKFIGPPPGDTTHPLLVTATAENAIADWFKRLDVRIVNADQVRHRVKQAADKAGGVLKDDELLKLLKDDDVADIVVLGRGGTTSGGSGVWYTFEATRMGGDNLGNTRWISDVDGKSAGAVDQAFDDIGHDVTCDLALKLMSEWKGNRRVDVIVTGVKNAAVAYGIMDDIKKGFDGIESADFGKMDGGRDGGTATFSLEYSSSYEDLARSLSRLSEGSGARFSVESSTREGVVLKATDAGAVTTREPEPAEERGPKLERDTPRENEAVNPLEDPRPAIREAPPLEDADR